MSRFNSALVIGAHGMIGAALIAYLTQISGLSTVVGLSRHSMPAIDLTDEESIRSAAEFLKSQQLSFDLVIVATGMLHDQGIGPEKSMAAIEQDAMMRLFQVNTIGPALILKHFSGLLNANTDSVFAVLSARVGSIGDNGLGGWYSYRASKAALNQIVRTASIEIRRKYPRSVVVALHPGTVDTPLSAPFSRQAKELQTPELAAQRLMTVIGGLSLSDNGGFLDHLGVSIPW